MGSFVAWIFFVQSLYLGTIFSIFQEYHVTYSVIFWHLLSTASAVTRNCFSHYPVIFRNRWGLFPAIFKEFSAVILKFFSSYFFKIFSTTFLYFIADRFELLGNNFSCSVLTILNTIMYTLAHTLHTVYIMYATLSSGVQGGGEGFGLAVVSWERKMPALWAKWRVVFYSCGISTE